MIDTIRGQLLAKSPMYVRIDVNGLGYGVHVPVSTYEHLGATGSQVSLHTYLHVRDNALELYGFQSEKERSVFALLLSVSGVGPKTALAVLSVLSVSEFQRVVASEEILALTSIPGIGKKTAQRIVLELKDKVAKEVPEVRPWMVSGVAGQLEADAVGALISLGSKSAEAVQAVRRAVDALGRDARLEEIVRTALKHI